MKAVGGVAVLLVLGVAGFLVTTSATDQIVISSTSVKAPTCAAAHVSQAQALATALGLTYGGCGDGDCASNPATCPLLVFADMDYMGSFRVPTGTSNGTELSASRPGIAYNPATDHLYIKSSQGLVAAINTPDPIIGAVSALNRASFQQDFYDISQGTLPADGTCGNSARTSGLLVYNSLLYASYDCYFDGAPVQATSQFSHSLTLATSSVSALSRLGSVTEQHAVSSALAWVPTEWQTLLGSKAIATGWGQTLIANGQSSGPNAFGFDPANVTGGAAVTAVPLLHYSTAHTTLGTWGNETTANPVFNMNSVPGGMAIIKNTRTLMHVYGSTSANAIGCYGTGTATLALHGTAVGDGSNYCYDPYHLGFAKGVNAYDPAVSLPDTVHVYYYALYDLNDLVTAKNSGNVWVPVPYEHGPMGAKLPLSWPIGMMGGMSYDYASNVMYIALVDVEEIATNINFPVISQLTFTP